MSEKGFPPYSVLMSVYIKDNPEYLDAAIASMVRQSVPFRDMVIVCDGPLTDRLDIVLERWKKELDERLTIHHLLKNSGLGLALAKGIDRCRCDVVARMDADDISRPNRCELLLEKLTTENLDLVGGTIEEFDQKPGDLGVVRRVPLEEDEIAKYLKRRNPFNHVTVMYRKAAVEDVGGYQSFPWMEDYWLWARMIAAECACANIPDVVVDVRTGNGMYIRRSNAAYLESQKRFFSELHKLGLVNEAERIRAVVERTISAMLPLPLVKVVYNKLLRKGSTSR